MSQPSKQLILSAAITGFGYHPGADTSQAQRLSQVAHYRQLLLTAERGLLDFILLHDERALATEPAYGRIDALSVLSRLAAETRSLGLALSVPTTYSEPFHVSRELATLDFVSDGRAAWNVTSIASAAEAANFGDAAALPSEQRQAISAEFVEVSRKLWDSWEDDAVIADRERGIYLDPAKLHHINHRGEHFKIRGPQITYRPPQGHVVVIQTEEQGAPLNGALADVLVLYHEALDAAQQSYAQYQQQAAQAGRQIRILHSVLPILGETEEQAQAYAAQLDEAAAAQVSGRPLPQAKRLVGTPAQVADQLASWFTANATDGFHFLPAELPSGLERLVDQLIPELQQRGLARSAYTGRTLREHLGLARPLSQYAAAEVTR